MDAFRSDASIIITAIPSADGHKLGEQVRKHYEYGNINGGAIPIPQDI